MKKILFTILALLGSASLFSMQPGNFGNQAVQAFVNPNTGSEIVDLLVEAEYKAFPTHQSVIVLNNTTIGQIESGAKKAAKSAFEKTKKSDWSKLTPVELQAIAKEALMAGLHGTMNSNDIGTIANHKAVMPVLTKLAQALEPSYVEQHPFKAFAYTGLTGLTAYLALFHRNEIDWTNAGIKAGAVFGVSKLLANRKNINNFFKGTQNEIKKAYNDIMNFRISEYVPTLVGIATIAGLGAFAAQNQGNIAPAIINGLGINKALSK